MIDGLGALNLGLAVIGKEPSPDVMEDAKAIIGFVKTPTMVAMTMYLVVVSSDAHKRIHEDLVGAGNAEGLGEVGRIAHFGHHLKVHKLTGVGKDERRHGAEERLHCEIGVHNLWCGVKCIGLRSDSVVCMCHTTMSMRR